MARFSEDEYEDYEESPWLGALGILLGWARKAALVGIAVFLLFYAASRFLQDGTRNCDLCGTPYKGGYTVRIVKDESILAFGKKAIAKIGGGEEETPVQANAYDVCPECEERVRASLEGMRGA